MTYKQGTEELSDGKIAQVLDISYRVELVDDKVCLVSLV